MPHAPTDALKRRHTDIRRALAAAGVDAFVVVNLANITYLTNFSGSSAIAVLTHDTVEFITDARYVTAVADLQASAHACPSLTLTTVEGSYDATLAGVLSRPGWKRIGFEASHVTVTRFRGLEHSLARGAHVPELVPMDGLVELARSVKDAYEIQVFRAAGRLLSKVTEQVLGFARPGVSERDLALEIDTAIRRAGFEKPAFETIVASGPHAALPHARPTERTLGEGDLVVLDFGGVYDSYCVDLTRTVVVGPPSPRALEVHAAVREAHDRAIAAAGPGKSRFDIDAAARDWLTAAGMGAAFGHGTGHGLGIDVHEDPRITRRGPHVDTSREAVVPGMVFTIEPGAYFPGWGGVRIEDDVLVTEAGVELLTQVTTELVTV